MRREAPNSSSFFIFTLRSTGEFRQASSSYLWIRYEVSHSTERRGAESDSCHACRSFTLAFVLNFVEIGIECTAACEKWSLRCFLVIKLGMNDCRERRKQRLFGSGKEDGGGLYPREKDESEGTLKKVSYSFVTPRNAF